jgi:hypothetical protein
LRKLTWLEVVRTSMAGFLDILPNSRLQSQSHHHWYFCIITDRHINAGRMAGPRQAAATAAAVHAAALQHMVPRGTDMLSYVYDAASELPVLTYGWSLLNMRVRPLRPITLRWPLAEKNRLSHV